MALGKADIIKFVNDGSLRIEPFDVEHVHEDSIDLWPDIKESIEIPPHGEKLLKLKEKISLPKTIRGTIIGKKTIRDKGLIAAQGEGNINPGHIGQIETHISNITDKPISVEPNDATCQIILDEITSIPKEEEINLLTLIKDWTSVLEYMISKEPEKPTAYPYVPCIQGRHFEYSKQGKKKSIVWNVFGRILDLIWRLPILLVPCWYFRFHFPSIIRIFLFLCALVSLRGFWIIFTLFTRDLEKRARSFYIYPKGRGMLPSVSKVNWLPERFRYSGKDYNFLALFGFVFFIAYVELFFWYLAIFTITGRSIVNVFSFVKAPIDVILLPFSMWAYGEREIFGFALSFAVVLEVAILVGLGIAHSQVEKYKKTKDEEEKKSAIRFTRIGLLITGLVFIEFAVMALLGRVIGSRVYPSVWFIWLLTILFPVGEIIMTRSIETNLWLTGNCQKRKEYWEKIKEALEIAFRKE